MDVSSVNFTSVKTVPAGAINQLGHSLQCIIHAFAQAKPEDKILQKTPYTFDVSVWEFFWPILNGAELVMLEPGAHVDSELLIEAINHYKISIIHFVPSMLKMFLKDCVKIMLNLLMKGSLHLPWFLKLRKKFVLQFPVQRSADR